MLHLKTKLKNGVNETASGLIFIVIVQLFFYERLNGMTLSMKYGWMLDVLSTSRRLAKAV